MTNFQCPEAARLAAEDTEGIAADLAGHLATPEDIALPTNPATIKELQRRLKKAIPFDEERTPLRETGRKAGQVDLQLIRFDLCEIRVDSDVCLECAGQVILNIESCPQLTIK